MADATCEVNGYVKPAETRKSGKPFGVGECRGCGGEIRRSGSRGSVRSYCSDDCRPPCRIDGCEKIAQCRGMCPMHYQRHRQTGDVGPASPTRNKHTGQVCSVAGCEQPRRKREWCAGHYSQWQRCGEVQEFTFKWAGDLHCVVCGAETGSNTGFRKFCSWRCAMLWRAHAGEVPESVACVQCGKVLTLADSGKNGRRLRSDTTQCRRCRIGRRKHGMSVEQLARRDGTDCGICREPVDMELQAPDPMRASVDHIVPRARGGTNDPANLQLAHLRCNWIKNDRIVEAA